MKKIYAVEGSISVEQHREDAFTIDWLDADGRRYHIWARSDGTITLDRILKRPPELCGDEVLPRLLNVNAKSNRPTVDAVIAFALKNELFDAAREQYLLERDILRRGAAAKRLRMRKQDHAVSLYGALSDLVHAIEVGSGVDVYANSARDLLTEIEQGVGE